MNDLRIIKKYPNRRQYDTKTSSYITLSGVKELIIEHIPFKIIHSKKGEDLTRSTILQIVSEEEANKPIFSCELLMDIIRSYGDSTQPLLSRFLEHSMQQFIKKQGLLKNPMSSFCDKNYSISLDDLAQSNIKSWEQSVVKLED